MTAALPQIAARVFLHQQRVAQRKVDADEWTRAEGDRRLAPWAAIASLAGADLPFLRKAIADEQTPDNVTVISGEWTPPTEAEARERIARDYASPREWHAVLARALQAARDRDPNGEIAGLLTVLTVALQVPVTARPREPERIAA